MSIYIEGDRADEFVAHLFTLPVEEAVALTKTAVRGANRRQNTHALFRSKAFVVWLAREDVQIAAFGAVLPVSYDIEEDDHE